MPTILSFNTKLPQHFIQISLIPPPPTALVVIKIQSSYKIHSSPYLLIEQPWKLKRNGHFCNILKFVYKIIDQIYCWKYQIKEVYIICNVNGTKCRTTCLLIITANSLLCWCGFSWSQYLSPPTASYVDADLADWIICHPPTASYVDADLADCIICRPPTASYVDVDLPDAIICHPPSASCWCRLTWRHYLSLTISLMLM